jgi:serine/threonine protein kinase
MRRPKTGAWPTRRRERFLREARAAAVVRHANVCPVYDIGEQKGGEADSVPFVVMAFIEGQDLGAVLAGGPLEPARALRLFAKIAAGLEAVHARKIVHRDLKPRNIVLDARDEPHLTDFGLSRCEGDVHLTDEGQVIGTPAYMPPEQLTGARDRIGPRTDIYSLGVLFYQMLTGRLPFDGTPLVLLEKITSQAPPPPSTVRPGLAPALDEIIAKAMACDPTERHASVADFAAAIAHGAQGWKDASQSAH